MRLAHHRRGREITDFILVCTSAASLQPQRAAELARALEAFVLMYQEHTAREDTVVFPAWHRILSPAGYHEMGEKFEDIERRHFGKDGFEDAVGQIAAIETQLGLADLAQFTAPAPPRVS